jgi:hypothetical protein
VIASQLSERNNAPKTAACHEKSALHVRLDTKKEKASRIYSVSNRLIPVREGQTSPLMLVSIEKNNFGPIPREPLSLFKEGDRFLFHDEGNITWSGVLTDKQLDATVEQNHERKLLQAPELLYPMMKWRTWKVFMDPESLTPRQRKVMDFILRYWVQNRVGPSVRELVEASDWCSSTSTMDRYLNHLVVMGYLRRSENRCWRSMVPLRDIDGTEIKLVVRRADGIEVVLGQK